MQKLLTVREVAELLGKSREWVYRRSDDGTLPCIRVGRSVRFKPTDLDAWLESHRQPPQG